MSPATIVRLACIAWAVPFSLFQPFCQDEPSLTGVVNAAPLKTTSSRRCASPSIESPYRRMVLSTGAASLIHQSALVLDPSPVGAIETSSLTMQEPPLPFQALESSGPRNDPPLRVGEWVDRPELKTSLGQERIGTTNPIRPLQQPIFGGEQELYYAPFLFGAWNTTATLKQKVFPFGPRYLPSGSLLEGSPRNRAEKVGHSCTYELHFFSTLANTLSNRITVNLGTGVPQSKVIQDRAYNIVSASKAYEQLTPVQDVAWDYRDNPYELGLEFGAGAVADDMRPLGPRRAKVYLNARTCEYGAPEGSGGEPTSTFCAAERSRSVTLAPGNVVVSDTESITEFTKVNDDLVTAISRIAVYLVPNPNSREGVLWQQVRGESVAFYDFDVTMHRMTEAFVRADGTTERRACVSTPQDLVQCS
jgi:hypothetical protein